MPRIPLHHSKRALVHPSKRVEGRARVGHAKYAKAVSETLSTETAHQQPKQTSSHQVRATPEKPMSTTQGQMPANAQVPLRWKSRKSSRGNKRHGRHGRAQARSPFEPGPVPGPASRAAQAAERGSRGPVAGAAPWFGSRSTKRHNSSDSSISDQRVRLMHLCCSPSSIHFLFGVLSHCLVSQNIGGNPLWQRVAPLTAT